MRKKVDSRVRTLVENGVKTRQRSMFLIVGDKARDQVVNLHYMLSKAVVKARPNVLWCYKTELHLSSNHKKRMKQIKKQMQRGLMDPEKEDPFSVFVASTSIRYCYYTETHKVLGQTFGMLVLQDFEAMTPNLLARTIETVEGGGIVVFLLSSLDSLSKLYTLTMDVHARFRTESHQDVVGRFNERFLLSLASCKASILMDDELNILPTSSHIKTLKQVPDSFNAGDTEEARELKDLQSSVDDVVPAGPLIANCRTIDQAKAVITFLDAASEKTLRATVALTAARGRGKSAALGLAIAGAVSMGYSNIFVTSPSPENLGTLFEFVFKGLDAMDYKEHIDYDLVESTNPAFAKAIVRVNVYRNHRQTIQYVQPHHAERVTQAELLVIDEAAAIPLPMVKALLGPYLVFLCSTVNGYEGTGRSLSLKLIQNLREQGAKLSSRPQGAGALPGGRLLKEVQLQEPIRYAPGDPIEKWLHDLLCLNASDHVGSLGGRMPHPSECQLYHVHRDTLFSHHKASEAFLQRMMALYVSSHYKNSPNDLQLMSDAPAHRLFVLLAPVDETKNALPDILCVVQVALEGAISRQNAKARLAAGSAPQGDMIPWTVGQQFQDAEFPTLSGIRVVRIATHPEVARAGYGSRALSQLVEYFEGRIADLSEADPEAEGYRREAAPGAVKDQDDDLLLSETMAPRDNLPPLLQALSDRPPERLHWIGTSFGLTKELHGFWSKSGFKPCYLRQTTNETTGENSCILVRELASGTPEGPAAGWLEPLVADFRTRFISLCSGPFKEMDPALALALLDPKIKWSDEETSQGTEQGERERWVVPRADGAALSPYDMKRLQSYAGSLVDHHMIADLVPPIARAFFGARIPVNLSYGQAAILLCVGLQQRDVSQVEEVLNLPASQVLALFNKAMRKVHSHLLSRKEYAADALLPRIQEVQFTPHAVGVDEDLEAAAAETGELAKLKQQALMKELGDLSQYAIAGSDADFANALGGKVPETGMVSMKGEKKKKKDKEDDTSGKRKGSENGAGGSAKKAKKDKSGKKERS